MFENVYDVNIVFDFWYVCVVFYGLNLIGVILNCLRVWIFLEK